MNLVNTKEEVQELTVKNTQRAAEIAVPTTTGRIVGVMVFYNGNDLGNSGIVNAWLKDSNGAYLSKPQHIENYRSRDAEYSKSYKPLNVAGGTIFSFGIISKTAFSKDSDFQVVLVYAGENEMGTQCNTGI